MASLMNLARMTTATTGTGTITLGSAVSGCLSFATAAAAAGVVTGDTITYGIEDGSSSEVGRGVWNSAANTLTRATILASTNGGSAINLSGTAEVFCMAAAEDFEKRLIASATPTGTGLVTFSSIPAIYRHLEVIATGRSTASGANRDVLVTFNNDTGSNYDVQRSQHTNTTMTAATSMGAAAATIGFVAGSSATAGFAGYSIFRVFDYRGTSLNKTGRFTAAFQSGTSAGNILVWDGYFGWRSALAINRIDLTLSSGNWDAGARVDLYGLR